MTIKEKMNQLGILLEIAKFTECQKDVESLEWAIKRLSDEYSEFLV